MRVSRDGYNYTRYLKQYCHDKSLFLTMITIRGTIEKRCEYGFCHCAEHEPCCLRSVLPLAQAIVFTGFHLYYEY